MFPPSFGRNSTGVGARYVAAAGTFFGVAGGVSIVTISKEDIEFEAFKLPFA
jgi:hypothetical protein